MVISQDACLVRLPLRFNVEPHGDHTDEEIIKAVKRVGLDEAVTRLGALDLVLAHRPFSHGQQQLLGLASAISWPGKIIVLDEAASG